MIFLLYQGDSIESRYSCVIQFTSILNDKFCDDDVHTKGGKEQDYLWISFMVGLLD